MPKIAKFNVRVTFQLSTVVADEIGNRTNVWADFYTCWAAVTGENGQEFFAAGIISDESDITIQVRYCREVAHLSSTNCRVVFNGVIYNVLSVDHMNYGMETMKFKCQKERRT